MRTVLEVAVTHGRGWGCDPSAWGRVWGEEGDDPNTHSVTVPEPYQAGNTEPVSHPTPRPSLPWRFLPARGWNWVNKRSVV